jgi:hypothetical protein
MLDFLEKLEPLALLFENTDLAELFGDMSVQNGFLNF